MIAGSFGLHRTICDTEWISTSLRSTAKKQVITNRGDKSNLHLYGFQIAQLFGTET